MSSQQPPTGRGLLARAERWASSDGRGPALLAVRSTRRFLEVRVTGLAAEMTYYALISVLPLLTALGAGLGFLQRLVGEQDVDRLQSGLVTAISGAFDEQVAADVLVPLVQSLLGRERTGLALGSVAVALWLAGRVFRAAIRALDDAYQVPERRGLLALWGLGLALSLSAVVLLLVVLAMVVIGPLMGGAQQLAGTLGLGESFEVLWSLARYPLVVVVSIGFLLMLYLHGPNVDNTWRECLPGAVLGTAGLIAVAAGLQLYLGVAGPEVPDVGDADAQVAVAARMIGTVLAAVLWMWLSSIVVLAGGVLNAEWQRLRRHGRGGHTASSSATGARPA